MKILGRVGMMILAAAGIALAPQRVEATGKFDGSVPMLCVPTVVTECGADGDCRRGTAPSVNLPEFLKVDLKAMKVYAEDTGRESPIRNLEHLNGILIIQGGQNGRGWTMTITEETGRMSSTISTEGEGFIIFGACTVVP
jgi:hypothetical protein